MSENKTYSERDIQNICNDSINAAIKCAEQGKKSCEACPLLEECKKTKEAIDELWKAKG